MRSILLILGVLAGLINTLMVGRYGFVTSDTAIDGAIAAFCFGIISLGAIGGPAVAVHFAACRRWVWGIIFGAIAAFSLCANVVNSLDALMGRSDKTQLERIKAGEDVLADRTRLAWLTAKRAAMAFTPAVKENVEAARAAVIAAAQVRIAECEERGPRCRDRESQEQTEREELATVLANKALNDKATRLDSEAAAIRARLDSAPAVQNVDPLGDAIGKLLHLPSEVAAAWHKASVVIVVELLIACALMAFELLGYQPKPAVRKIEAPPVPRRQDNVVPMVQPEELATAEGHVARFMLVCLPRSDGDEVTWVDAFARYRRWCSEQAPKITPLNSTTFGQELQQICKYVGIRTRAKGEDVVCLNVKLVA